MSKKVLSLVLALVMVLGTFGTAFAASFPDTVETVFDGAVDRLSLLEILEGYPDGTFKPENQITRAEFAAVAVRAKGLEDAANAAKGLATGFTDVAPAPAHWAAGYVGTAARLGIVNGVGGGLFAPEAPVKYEEAITMIVRALGYEPSAQAKGGYPYGYLIVANEIGLLDQVKGTQGTPATRGTVAQITDNALEIPKMIQVGFGADAKWVVSGSKEHGTDAEAQYLLHDLGVDEIKGHVTNTLRTKSTVKADEVEINGVKYDIAEGVDTDAVLGVGVTAWSKNDVVFSITVGYKIKSAGKDIVFSKDQVIYDRIVAADTTDDEAYLYKLDDEYDWANKARIFVNNEDVDAEDIPDRAYGRFVLNEDDEVEFAYLFDVEASNTGLVTEIDKTDLDYVNLNADDDVLALDDAEEIYVFNKDLSAAKLDDIKANTAVFYHVDEDDNYFIIISDETVEGTLEAVRVRDSRITVEGTNVKFEQDHSIYSLDDQEEYEVLTNFEDIEEYVDEEVTVYLNLVGDTLALVTDTEATTSKMYGVATWLTSARNPVLSVYTQEGKEVDYTFEETDDITATFKGLFTNGEPKDVVAVGFKVNKDGEIREKSFEYESDEYDFNKADNKKYGSYNGKNLYITEDTVVLQAYNKDAKLKPSVIKYANIINKAVDTDNGAVVLLDKGSDLALLIFSEPAFLAVDDAEYGVVTSDPTVRGTTYRAEIDVFGKGKETYVISKTEDAKALRTGDLIEFRLNDKGEVLVDAEVDFRTDRDKATVYETVSSKSGNYITTNRDTYRRTTDTVIYSATKSGGFGSASNYSRIDKNSVLLLIANSDDELKVVLDITAYRDGKPVTTPTEATGVVTYITATAGSEAIEVETNGKVVEYKLTGAARDLVSQVVVGDEVTLVFTEGRLTGITVVKSAVSKAKAALTTDITAATTLHAAAVEGADNDQYASGSKATLNTAISAANTVATATSPKSTQAEIDAAKTTLAAAVTTFKAGKVHTAGDKTALQAAWDEADALHTAAVEGITAGTYPLGTKAILKAANDAAKVHLDKVTPSPSAETLATALADLNEVVTAFKANINK